MGDVQITLYKNIVTLRVFDKMSMNTRLVIRQRADLFKANISASKISLPQGQSYTEREC